jgi:hypothetical protein
LNASNSIEARANSASSRVRDQIRLVVQAGGEFVDVEGTVESRAQLVTVNQQPDFSGLADKQASDARGRVRSPLRRP